jgi:RNA polymerase sigma-70 factor (ECF subfamily)
MPEEAGFAQRREWVLGLVERCEIPLIRFAKRLLGDEDAARDVVQYAFLRLCDQSPEELKDRAVQWLYTVCRNRAVDCMRARQKTASLEDSSLPHCPSREADPAVTAESRDLYRRLNQLIEQLPVSQREAVTLWAEGLSSKEIAATIGVTEGNVRVLVHRAFKALRQHPLAQRLAAVPRRPGRPERRPVREIPL